VHGVSYLKISKAYTDTENKLTKSDVSPLHKR